MMETCTRCGQPSRPGLRLVEDERRDDGRRQVAELPDGVSEYYRRTPARPPTAVDDVVIPLGQAATTAVAVGVLAAIVATARSWPWYWPAAVSATTFAVAWLMLLRQAIDSRYATEHVIREQEPAENETVAEATVAATRLSVFMPDGGLHEVAVPVSAERIHTVARALASGAKPWSKREWCGRGRPLDGGDFDELTAAFMRLGWLRWRDERHRQQGMELSPAGRHGMASLAAGRVLPEHLFRELAASGEG